MLLGKLATHEFALGGPSFDLPFPPARNPWNPDHIPGGSSSGSGAAVAAGLVRMAMGSDTGGSIRGPAGYCGTIGLKPTYGLVSRRGVFPLSYTLDHCGPLSWTVEDSAIAMEVIAGFDPLDPASADVPVPDFRGKLGKGVAGIAIGLPRHWFVKADGRLAETVRAIDDAAQTLAKLGATIEEIELPDYELFNACGRVIMFSEAFAIHEKDYQTRPLDFGLYTYLRMSMGAFVTAADLTQAMRLRRELALAVNAKLKSCDALITASTLAPAARVRGGRSEQPAELPDPDHAVRRHRQPGDVDPDRFLGQRLAAVDADRRPRLRRADGARHRRSLRGGDQSARTAARRSTSPRRPDAATAALPQLARSGASGRDATSCRKARAARGRPSSGHRPSHQGKPPPRAIMVAQRATQPARLDLHDRRLRVLRRDDGRHQGDRHAPAARRDSHRTAVDHRRRPAAPVRAHRAEPFPDEASLACRFSADCLGSARC